MKHGMILLMMAALLGAGCKLKVSVPPGGRVVSQSGAYTCTQAKPCTIDVVDAFFDETFVAKPDEGYSFKQWKKKAMSFCGGKSTSCALSTSFMSGNAALLAFLNNDDVYVIEPEWSQDGGGGGVSKKNADGCYNPDLAAVGNVTVSQFKSVPKDGGEVIRSRLETNVTGAAKFNGRQATRAVNELTLPDDPSVVTQSNSYFLADNGKKRTKNLGTESETFRNGKSIGTTVVEFDPELLTRFDLAAGASYVQEYKSRITNSFGGSTMKSTITQTVTTTYVGVEKITVPAGTFNACKFREESKQKQFGLTIKSVRRLWYGVGNGLQLREDNESSVTELVSAKIDGQSI